MAEATPFNIPNSIEDRARVRKLVEGTVEHNRKIDQEKELIKATVEQIHTEFGIAKKHVTKMIKDVYADSFNKDQVTADSYQVGASIIMNWKLQDEAGNVIDTPVPAGVEV